MENFAGVPATAFLAVMYSRTAPSSSIGSKPRRAHPKALGGAIERLAARAIPVKRTVRKGDIFIRLERHAALHPRRAPSVSNRVPHPLSQRFTPYVSATYPIPATNPAPRSAPYAYAAASVVVVAAPVDDADAEAFAARPAFSRHSLVSVVAA